MFVCLNRKTEARGCLGWLHKQPRGRVGSRAKWEAKRPGIEDGVPGGQAHRACVGIGSSLCESRTGRERQGRLSRAWSGPPSLHPGSALSLRLHQRGCSPGLLPGELPLPRPSQQPSVKWPVDPSLLVWRGQWSMNQGLPWSAEGVKGASLPLGSPRPRFLSALGQSGCGGGRDGVCLPV